MLIFKKSQSCLLIVMTIKFLAHVTLDFKFHLSNEGIRICESFKIDFSHTAFITCKMS